MSAKTKSKKSTKPVATGIDDLIHFLSKPCDKGKVAWLAEAELVLSALIESKDGRYDAGHVYREDAQGRDGRYRIAKESIAVRVSSASVVDRKNGKPTLSWAALLNSANSDGGAYGGSSIVLFASEKHRPLMTFCVGTQGIAPDEMVLANPGHARRLDAICKFINRKYGRGKVIAWAKDNPCKTSSNIPPAIVSDIVQVEKTSKMPRQGIVNTRCGKSDPEPDPDYELALKERKYGGYGNVIYGVVNLESLSSEAVTVVACMFLDLFVTARGVGVRANSFEKNYQDMQALYKSVMFPDLDEASLWENLKNRKYVIIEGPPGTGKTTLADNLDDYLSKKHEDFSVFRVQFHPNMTYERFIGGIFPAEDSSSSMNFSFVAKKGILLLAIEDAIANPKKKVLLHIDEINRADLARVLGEAIFLFEPHPKTRKPIKLGNNFKFIIDGKESLRNEISMPENLYVLGTMNSADRSIAIMDIAIRRRFAFMQLYPQISMLNDTLSDDLGRIAFSQLVDVFIDHASTEAFKYVPGHSYFMLRDGVQDTKQQILTELIPLLRAYIDDGCVAGFEDEIRAYIDRYENLCLEVKMDTATT